MEAVETLADKMRKFESVSSVKLEVKTPVLIRLDGKAFHTYTKGFNKPFDKDLSEVMQYVAMQLANEVQNIKFIYSQSDEISLLLTDWDNPNTDTWYGNRVQKLVSVSASYASVMFNQKVSQLVSKYWKLMMSRDIPYEEEKTYNDRYDLLKSKKYSALFDGRAFNLPVEEVCNYFIWRYNDAKRNAIQALAQSQFSHKELNGVKTTEMIQMVKDKSGIDYNELSTVQKTGFAIYKDEEDNWKLDLDIPDFYENREFIEKWINK